MLPAQHCYPLTYLNDQHIQRPISVWTAVSSAASAQLITGKLFSRGHNREHPIQAQVMHFCLDFFLLLSLFVFPFITLMKILLPPSTMFSDFLVELIKKLRGIPSKRPLKNLSLFWSALAKLKYLLSVEWRDKQNVLKNQCNTKHKEQGRPTLAEASIFTTNLS